MEEVGLHVSVVLYLVTNYLKLLIKLGLFYRDTPVLMTVLPFCKFSCKFVSLKRQFANNCLPYNICG